MKLKQKVISLSILFACMFMTGVSAADSQELVIKAYKIARSDQKGITEFVVTDALADFDDLDKISDTRNEIILDRHIGTYLGRIERLDDKAFSEQIVFSVRIAGAGTSSYNGTSPLEEDDTDQYKVTMIFSPFVYGDNGDETSTLDACYQLGNITGIFEANSSSTHGSETITMTKGTDYVYNSGSLSFNWQVTTDTGSLSQWTVRAAVAMTIGEDSYNNCTQYGKHSATVTVKLEAV